MKPLFIAAGPVEWGSSRMRAWWVTKALQGMGYDAHCDQYKAVAATHEAFSGGFDTYVWQKNFDRETAEKLDGRHFWDACDPAWWWMPDYCREIMRVIDGAICSSDALANDLREWCSEEGFTVPIFTIPDRFNLDHITARREHNHVSPVRFIWYGVAVNRIALYSALANLERLAANGHKIELTVMDDRPDLPLNFTGAFPVYHVRWSLDREVEIISGHDVALTPRYPGAWGKVKSRNRSDLANLCGLPAWDGMSYGVGVSLCETPSIRYVASDIFIDDLDVKHSAADWLEIMETT